MPIVKAVGLGVAILVLKTLTPAVFTQMESTAITFLKSAESGAAAAAAVASTLHDSTSSKRALALPQAPSIRRSP